MLRHSRELDAEIPMYNYSDEDDSVDKLSSQCVYHHTKRTFDNQDESWTSLLPEVTAEPSSSPRSLNHPGGRVYTVRVR